MDNLFSDVARNFHWGEFGKARGLGAIFQFLQFFNKNNAALYVYFGQNGYFKTITYQLKAFENQSKCTK